MMLVTAITIPSCNIRSIKFRVRCSDSKSVRGFGAKKDSKGNKVSEASSRDDKGSNSQQRLSSNPSSPSTTEAPGVSSRYDDNPTTRIGDIQFEQRLAAVRRSAMEKKKADDLKDYGPIDYDTPVESDKKTVDLATKLGVGVAVVVFGLVFAFGDFLPSMSDVSNKKSQVVETKLSEEDKTLLETRLKEYEKTLAISGKDPIALEGTAVTLIELGEYSRAATVLQDLAKEKSTDPDVFRLLGEVKYALRDYGGSSAAYKLSTMIQKNFDLDVVRGYTDALLADKKPDEAVQFLLTTRERLQAESDSPNVDPIQVDLLLGKAYSDWGHVSDAVAVYDQLISSHPNDFRGYLAKGIILKENGDIGNAERMFIQARYFAPQKAKSFVDRYAKQ